MFRKQPTVSIGFRGASYSADRCAAPQTNKRLILDSMAGSKLKTSGARTSCAPFVLPLRLSSRTYEGKLTNVATEGDGKTHTKIAHNLQLCPLAPEHPLFRSLPFHPKVASAIHQLLCRSDPEQSACCYLSQVFWKPARHGLGTAWHQDNAYFQVEDATQGTAMWTAIHDANIKNGTMQVVDTLPEILPHERELTSDHHITCKACIDEQKAVPVELKAGGVIFFDYNVPHCTTANTTENPRAGVAYHFLNQAHFRDRVFPLPDDADWKTPVVVGPLCTNGRAEYGQKVDFWEGITGAEI
ncbi:hypothetical protein CYMTET_17836 [Cymbomonas tetramitiformis]|uniref:Phytanoyl-CoA dioxygenase n=1 Tax=Cymbomonas tetramitiformis TaxID=36881 RepID=A0AAE0G9G7_9CHLO|nr:hypothetical protein CYMTET_17836 [Cymbomonas tetramitiformis]